MILNTNPKRRSASINQSSQKYRCLIVVSPISTLLPPRVIAAIERIIPTRGIDLFFERNRLIKPRSIQNMIKNDINSRSISTGYTLRRSGRVSIFGYMKHTTIMSDDIQKRIERYPLIFHSPIFRTFSVVILAIIFRKIYRI